MNVETLWTILTRPLSDEAIETAIKTFPELLNLQLKSGDSILHSAIANDQQKLALALIKYTFVERNEISSVNFLTPVSLSIKLNQPDVAIALIKSGADLRKSSYATHAFDKIVDRNKRREVKSLFNETLKMQESVKTTNKPVTVDKLATLLESCKKDEISLELIINAHKDILNDSMQTFSNLMFWVIYHKYHDICKLLIAAGVDLNFKSPRGNSALIYAISHSAFTCARQLILAGADVKIENDNKETALYYVNRATDCTATKDLRYMIESRLMEKKLVVAQPEQKPEETFAKPEETFAKPEEMPKVDISVGLKVIKFMRDNNIDHTFNNNQITAALNDKVIEFALANGVPYKTSNGQTIISLA